MLKYKLVPIHSFGSAIVHKLLNFEEITYIEKSKTYIDVETRIFRKLFKHYVNEYIIENKNKNIIIVNTCEVFGNWEYQSLNTTFNFYSNVPVCVASIDDLVFNRYIFWSLLQKTLKTVALSIKTISHNKLSSRDIIKYLSNVYIGEKFVDIEMDQGCIFCDLNYSFPDMVVPKYLYQQLEIECKKKLI